MALTLNYHGQIWNLPYLNQIWSDCHEMKSKHIDWTLSRKCSHRVWPWLWPWPWVFKVKFLNSLSSGIGVPIDNEQPGVIHDHDRNLLVTKMRCKELPDGDRGDLRCRRAVDLSCVCVRVCVCKKQATPSVGCRFIDIYCTVLGEMCSLHLKFILL